MLMFFLPMKPSIGALLLSKKSELTIPVQQQEERTYEVLHCVYIYMSLTLSAHALGITVVILSVCVSTYIISYVEQLIS